MGEVKFAVGSSPAIRMLSVVMIKTHEREKSLIVTAERWKSSRWSRQSRSKFKDIDRAATTTCNQTGNKNDYLVS